MEMSVYLCLCTNLSYCCCLKSFSVFTREADAVNVHVGDLLFSLLKLYINTSRVFFFCYYLKYFVLPLMSYHLLHVTVFHCWINYSDWIELTTQQLIILGLYIFCSYKVFRDIALSLFFHLKTPIFCEKSCICMKNVL